MAFTYFVNNAFTNYGAALLDFKARLKAAGWTVMASGDGLSAYSSSGDILTVSNPGVDTANAITNRLSWWRIRDPGGVRELLFVAGNSGNLFDRHLAFYSPSAGFTGAGWGAVGAAQNPSATDHIRFAGRNSDNISDQSLWGTAATSRYDIVIGDADEDYSFYCLSRTASGVYQGGVIYDVLADPVEDLPDPIVVYCPASRTASNGMFLNDGRNLDPFPLKGDISVDNVSTNWPWIRLDPVTDMGGRNVWIQTLGSIGNSSDCTLWPANVYSGAIDVVAPCYWSARSVPIASGPAAGQKNRGNFFGRSRLIVAMGSGITGSGVASMDTDTGKTRIAQPVTNMCPWFRWDGVTTPTL